MSKKKNKGELTHAQKQVKALKDARDTVTLLAVLLVMIVGWNFWIRGDISKLEDQILLRDESRQKVDEMTTEEFISRARVLRDTSDKKRDLREEITVFYKAKRGLKGKEAEDFYIDNARNRFMPGDMTEYYVNIDDVQDIEMGRLLDMLVSIRSVYPDIYCTELKTMKPRKYDDGYVMVTTKSGPFPEAAVYNIKSLQFSRFVKGQRR